MGRSRTSRGRSAALTVEQAQPPVTIEETEQDEELRAMARIKAELGDGNDGPAFRIRVCEMVSELGRAPKEYWIFDCQPNDLPGLRDRLRENGAGHYRCRVLEDETGRIVTQYDIRIKTRVAAPAGAPAGAPAVSAAPPPTPPDAITQILQNQMRMLELALTRAATPPPAAFNLESVGALILQGVGIIKAVKELMPAPVSPNIGIEMFTKGLELARTLEPEAKEGGIMGVLERVLSNPEIAGAIGRIAQAGAVPAAGAPPGAPQLPAPRHVLDRSHVQPAPAPLPPPPGSPPANMPGASPGGAAAGAPAGGLTPEQQQQQAQAIAAVGAALDHLIENGAKVGQQPENFSDWLQDSMPPELLAYLDTLPDPVGFLVTYFPQIVPHRPWFTRLIESLYSDGGPANPLAPAGAPGAGEHAGAKPN